MQIFTIYKIANNIQMLKIKCTLVKNMLHIRLFGRHPQVLRKCVYTSDKVGHSLRNKQVASKTFLQQFRKKNI